MIDLATITGAATFFDGRTSARHDVRVTLGAAVLDIEGSDGHLMGEWRYDELEQLSAPAGVLRLGRRGSPLLERLQIYDADFAHLVDLRAASVDRTGTLQRRQRLTVIGWTLIAVVALVLTAWFGVPAIAERLALQLPASLDRKLGDAVEMQVRATLDTGHAGKAFECGLAADERAGRAALDKLTRRLATAAALPGPLNVTVVRRKEANAMALPGGHIYVFEGLIGKAAGPDELAGVIAHEIGHVAHRDGTKAVLHAGGLSFLFGMLLGDFVGGGAVVMGARSVLQSSYSRAAEAAADLYGAQLLAKAGGDPRALGVILGKIGGATEPGMKILLDHPETAARVAAINKVAGKRPAVPLLSPDEWTAVTRICAG
ncbi:MAG TPA: M48 family metallopeptidase [Pseudolabrys sp.]|nr:M48 family metallopeptidase [Pseudolabrys sp.]